MAGHGTGQTGARNRAYDKGSAANRTVDLDPPEHQFTFETLTQMTAPGDTASRGCELRSDISWQVTVAGLDGVNDEIVLAVMGSNDGTSFGELELKSTTKAGITVANSRATIDTDGTYVLECENVQAKQTYLDWISETDDTNQTVDPVYGAGR